VPVYSNELGPITTLVVYTNAIGKVYRLPLRTLGSVRRRWELVVRTLGGVERLNAACDIGFTHVLDKSARELSTLDRAVIAYRDGIPRHNGPIVPPTPHHTNRKVEVSSYDPFWYLGWRLTQPDDLWGSTKLGQIAANLLASQNARGTVHMRMGNIADAPEVDRDYSDGSKLVSDAIVSTLCEIAQGIWVRIDAVDEDEIMAALTVLYPDPGVHQPNARFEFGDGTIGNLADYDVQYGQVINDVQALGASFGAGQETALAHDDASQQLYGIFDDQASFTDEEDTVGLQQHADQEIKPAPPTVISVTPLSTEDNSSGAIFVPMLFDDFDVGDVAPIYIRDDEFELQANCRITEATVEIADESGRETLTSLTLEVV
jgi:hypothetical protein